MTEWPPLLHDLVRQHGYRKVWAVGLMVLKFPPTWVTWEREAKRLTSALNNIF